jgi:hypothetical protein
MKHMFSKSIDTKSAGVLPRGMKVKNNKAWCPVKVFYFHSLIGNQSLPVAI